MIAFLVGTIEYKSENSLILDVNGVGYELAISNNTLLTLPNVGETIKILTYMQVSENTGVTLYGFGSEEEKSLFLKLITVSGIGPKIAIGILSGMKLSDLIVSIINEDSNSLSKIKGLGKKGAERICSGSLTRMVWLSPDVVSLLHTGMQTSRRLMRMVWRYILMPTLTRCPSGLVKW